jgi:hypothetical protein
MRLTAIPDYPRSSASTLRYLRHRGGILRAGRRHAAQAQTGQHQQRESDDAEQHAGG